MIDLRCGNNIELIKDIEDKSLDCIITSPPYFNTGKKYQRGKGYHYTSDFPKKHLAKIEAHFNRLDGKFARIAKLPDNRWGVYVREKW